MKKLIVIISLFVLVACGKTNDEIDVDDTCNNIVKALNNNELVQVDDDLITSYYFLDADNIIDSSLYVSKGTEADQVCVLKLKNTDGIKDELLNSLNIYKASFDNYFPEEVSKIDNAYIYNLSDYYIIVISDLENLKNIVESNLVFE